jgi:transposase InsO family protein
MAAAYQKVLGADMVTLLDGVEGYFAIPITKEDRHKTAIRLPISMEADGLFQLRVVLFGLKNGGTAFDRWMTSITAPLEDVVSMRDDIAITTARRLGETDSQVEQRHAATVEGFLQIFGEAGGRLKPKKIRAAIWASEGFEFLGYHFKDKRMMPQRESVDAIMRFKAPTDMAELRRLNGAVEWVRQFIPGLSKIGLALTEAAQMPEEIKAENAVRRAQSQPARTNWKLELSLAAQEAFQDIQKAVVGCLALEGFQHDAERYETILWADASGYGLGGILLQRDRTNGRVAVVACASRKMTAAERNYIPTEQECLAIYFAVHHWQHWLEGVPGIVVKSDHQALQYLMDHAKVPGRGRLIRWVLFLQEFDLRVEHVGGTQNAFADWLSRCCAFAEEGTEATEARVMVAHEGVEGGHTMDLAQEQLSCPEVTAIRHWLKQGQLPRPWQGSTGRRVALARALGKRVELFEEKDSILWIAGRSENDPRRLVVPVSARRRLLEIHHDLIGGGHLGADRVRERLRPRYWWPGMRGDIDRYVQSCHVCQRVKLQRVEFGDLSPIGVYGVFEYVHLDLIGPLPLTIAGCRYILVIVDRGSKRVILVALPDKSAKTVAWHFVTRVICEYGVAPRFVQTDQGTEFINSTMGEVERVLGMTHVKGAAYRPQTNGMVERMNLPIESILASFEDVEQRTWDMLLPFVQRALNSTVSASTGQTPDFLTFGREGTNPIDVVLGVGVVAPSSREKWLGRLQEAQRLAGQSQERKWAAMKERFDKDHEKHTFAVGDRVWVREARVPQGKTAKLRPKASPVVYVIRELTGGNQKHARVEAEANAQDTRSMHVERLKKVIPEAEGLFGEVPVEEAPKEKEDADVYEVERILDRREGRQQGTIEYLVRWLGYGPQEDRWVKAHDMSANELVADFERQWLFKEAAARAKPSYADVAKALLQGSSAKKVAATAGRHQGLVKGVARKGRGM